MRTTATTAGHTGRLMLLSAGLLMALAGLGACRSEEPPPAPTRAAPTVEPTSTFLPPLPTLPAPGSEENPLQFMLAVPEGGDEAAAQALAGVFLDETGLAVEVRLIERQAEGYRALCDGSAVVASLDALGYLAAQEAGCGEALFQTEIDGEVEAQSQLVGGVNRVFSVTNFGDRAFCRSDARSVTGWIIPALALRAYGVDPSADLGEVIDAGDDEAVLAMIGARECDVGATAVGAEESLDDPAAIDVIELLPPVPYDVLAVSSRLDAPARAVLADFFREHEIEIAGLLGVDRLRAPDEGRFDPLRLLIEAAGVDVLALGE